MTNKELADAMRQGLFSQRDSVEEAFAYAYEVIEAMPAVHRIGAFTALHVVVNTIANHIETNESN